MRDLHVKEMSPLRAVAAVGPLNQMGSASRLVRRSEREPRLHAGSCAPRNLDVIEVSLGRLDVMDLDLGAAEHVVQIRARLSAAGLPIGPFDVMIAGHARSL